MNKKVIYEVTLARLVRETATFHVELDESVDADMVDTGLLAESVYKYEAGEVTDLWVTDQEYVEQGTCTAERYTGTKKVKTLAVVRGTDCYLETNFK